VPSGRAIDRPDLSPTFPEYAIHFPSGDHSGFPEPSSALLSEMLLPSGQRHDPELSDGFARAVVTRDGVCDSGPVGRQSYGPDGTQLEQVGCSKSASGQEGSAESEKDDVAVHADKRIGTACVASSCACLVSCPADCESAVARLTTARRLPVCPTLR
jgi:hypothetical protein